MYSFHYLLYPAAYLSRFFYSFIPPTQVHFPPSFHPSLHHPAFLPSLFSAANNRRQPLCWTQTDSIPVGISETLICVGRHVIGFVDRADAGTLTYAARSVHAIRHGPAWGRHSICIHFSVLIMCFFWSPSGTIDSISLVNQPLQRPRDCEDYLLFKCKTYVIVCNLSVYQTAIVNRE